MSIKIKKRDRDYGLFTWGKEDDFEIFTMFGKKEHLRFSVCGKEMKDKKVSYKYRRFTLGKKLFDQNKSSKNFLIEKGRNCIKIDFE